MPAGDRPGDPAEERAAETSPGASKWNKIEHRLFSLITLNWRGRPLRSLATIVSRIGSTRTRTGLWMRAELDPGKYPKGRKITDDEMAKVRVVPDEFHGEWNYTLFPHRAKGDIRLLTGP